MTTGAEMGIRECAIAGLAAGLLLGTGAQAALVPLTLGGVDVVCDDDYTPVGASSAGLIWTADANLATSATFGVTGINANGTMTWDKAQEWIAAMNTANYGGANDWRFWSARNSDGSHPCFGFNCTDSELGHLFYVEGGLTAGSPITDSSALTGVFTNLQDGLYWSNTEIASDPNLAWLFHTGNGSQGSDYKVGQHYGWAVRPGQCRAAPSPAQPVPALGTWRWVLGGWVR